MDELKPCPFCGCKVSFVRDCHGWNKVIGEHSNKCPLDGNNLLTWSSEENAPILDKWNTRADGWISVGEHQKCSGRYTVNSSYGVRDAFFSEGFVADDFRWQDCETGNDEGVENHHGIEFEVYNWMPLPAPPKAVK